MDIAKIGRPRKEFDKEQFEKLCALQCTEEEIAGWFGFSTFTLNTRCKETYEGRTFFEVFKIYSTDGKISLRRTQFKLAETSAIMAIWLGKQSLNQQEKNEQTVTVQVFPQKTMVFLDVDSDTIKTENSAENSRIPTDNRLYADKGAEGSGGEETV